MSGLGLGISGLSDSPGSMGATVTVGVGAGAGRGSAAQAASRLPPITVKLMTRASRNVKSFFMYIFLSFYRGKLPRHLSFYFITARLP